VGFTEDTLQYRFGDWNLIILLIDKILLGKMGKNLSS
jgi:hypothetical protein